MPHILEVRDARLIVLGANGAYKEELARLSAVEGVSNHVLFPGFVTEAEYQRTISASNLVALVSSDEGFGLPIAEAAFFGIPALITDDSGMGAIFEGYPTEVAPDPLSIAHGALRAMTSTTNRTEPRATPSWASTVQLLRDALQRTSSSATRESR
jgi:glycosyltransferase involved in cell wall biosynthesis